MSVCLSVEGKGPVVDEDLSVSARGNPMLCLSVCGGERPSC